MKKLILPCFLLLYGTSFGQIFKKAQEPATATRAYLWDLPKTDSLPFGKLYVVKMFDYTGKNPFNVLTDSVTYTEIQTAFNDSMFLDESQRHIIGFEYLLEKIDKFSFLKRVEYRDLSADKKKSVRAWNEKEKFVLEAQAPRIVNGLRNADGSISPDFVVTTTPIQPVQTQPQTQTQQKTQQTQSTTVGDVLKPTMTSPPPPKQKTRIPVRRY